MQTDFNRVREVVQAIVDRLHHPAARWTIQSVALSEHVPVRRGQPSPTLILVTLAAGTETVGAYFRFDIRFSEAVAGLASQIQDHLIEAAQGAALPPCPGHAHPLIPRVVGDHAIWVCPKDPTHHQIPIIPSQLG